jgi:hypothetical protein
MSEHDASHTCPGAAEAWMRFMAAALSAAPHAPADKLAATADEALAEYQNRQAVGRFVQRGADGSGAAEGTDATPFVARVEGDLVAYEPNDEAPDDDDINSPFRPSAERDV